MAACKIVRRFGAYPRYNLVVDEDVVETNYFFQESSLWNKSRFDNILFTVYYPKICRCAVFNLVYLLYNIYGPLSSWLKFYIGTLELIVLVLLYNLYQGISISLFS